MARKSVWIINHYAIPPSLPGITRHFDLACELAKHGYDVVIWASAFSHVTHKKIRLFGGGSWGVEPVGDVNFVWVPSLPYKGNSARRFLNMMDFALRVYFLGQYLPKHEKAVSPPSVIIGSTVHPFAVLAGFHLSRYYGSHFVMEIRDLWPQTPIDMGAWRENQLQTKFFRSLERFSCDHCERIITLSPLTSAYLGHYSKEWEKKVVYIPNGTRVDHFRGIEITKRSSSSPLPMRITYAGAIGISNGIDRAIRAVQIVNQKHPGLVELTIIGDGPEKSNLIQLVSTLQVKNVHFIDAVPHSNVPNLLAAADILLLIQREVLYGSSNKLYDYMASGKPLIFAVFAEHNNLVSQVGCGITASPDSSDDIADAMIRMSLLSESERSIIGQKGREYVANHHDYATLGNRLAHTLDELIA